jgi:hypothetical protein
MASASPSNFRLLAAFAVWRPPSPNALFACGTMLRTFGAKSRVGIG